MQYFFEIFCNFVLHCRTVSELLHVNRDYM